MIKRLRFSLKKSRILAKITKEVKSKKNDFQSVQDEIIKGLVNGKTLSRKELYIEKLFSLLSEDRYTISVLRNKQLKFDDLRDMITVLELNGAGQIVNGHYVPVSSIAFIDTLVILCDYWATDGFIIQQYSKNDSNQMIAHKMTQSF